jgi:hypothetical protein
LVNHNRFEIVVDILEGMFRSIKRGVSCKALSRHDQRSKSKRDGAA